MGMKSLGRVFAFVAGVAATSCVQCAHANAVAVTNLALLNASNGFAEIHFDLSWSNSWRTAWTENGGATYVTNWDAVWIHAQQRVSGGDWAPCYFSASNHSVASGFALEIGTNGGGTNVGAMIHRDGEGFGGVSLTNVVLSWNYALAGLYGTSQVDIALFAIEMVCIPEGAFYLGDGTPGAGQGQFFAYPNTNQPFLVTNENAIATGAVTGGLNWRAYGGAPGGTLSNAFPKGFRSFYAMKYEITQGQYADFLNHITPGRAATRYPGSVSSSYRQSVRFTNNVYVADAPDRASNFMSLDDFLVYLDWAGLRPLTELEYEKMCRGFKYPVAGEYAYGGDTAPVYLSGIAGIDGSGSETATPAGANFFPIDWRYGSIKGPVRVGVFATPNSTRVSSGAGYFGNMDLCGNVNEIYIAVGTAPGLRFVGDDGDGQVAAQPPSWPSNSSSGGAGIRGVWDQTYLTDLRASVRQGMEAYSVDRGPSTGGRGGRTLP